METTEVLCDDLFDHLWVANDEDGFARVVDTAISCFLEDWIEVLELDVEVDSTAEAPTEIAEWEAGFDVGYTLLLPEVVGARQEIIEDREKERDDGQEVGRPRPKEDHVVRGTATEPLSNRMRTE